LHPKVKVGSVPCRKSGFDGGVLRKSLSPTNASRAHDVVRLGPLLPIHARLREKRTLGNVFDLPPTERLWQVTRAGVARQS
jgi:hypothetical protein